MKILKAEREGRREERVKRVRRGEEREENLTGWRFGGGGCERQSWRG